VPERRVKPMLTGAVAYVLLALGTCVSALAAAADFNDDGKQDVLWRLPSGKPLIWQMNGLFVSSQHTVALSAGAEASIIGAGRFFGAAAPAVAWVDSSDNLRLWQIASDGGVVQNCIAASGIDPTWKFLAIADINNDGRDDVLWRFDDGILVVSLIDGCNAPTTLTLSDAAKPGWTFVGSGRRGATNQTDLLWTDSGANNLIIWAVAADGGGARTAIPAGAQTGWIVSAVADFTGDQRADILWRNPDGSALTLWINGDDGYTSMPVTAAAAGEFGAADGVFSSGFDFPANPAPPLTADWTILDAADYDGDGNADLLLANSTGDSAIWLMNGASVQATARFEPMPDMPLPGVNGWRLPLDRPTVTKVGGQVSVDWNALPGSARYSVYTSATNAPASSGSTISSPRPPLLFQRTDPGYADKRYFAVAASYHGFELPPSKEAYIVEFTQVASPVIGFLSVTDLNGDGCPDIFRVIGDCHGNFGWTSPSSTGLDRLYADAGIRDVRMADFNGDGILDIIANVYTCDSDLCGGMTADSRILMMFGDGDGTYTQATAFNANNEFGGGYGETIVVADFNNDGCLDIYLPRYTYYDPAEHSLLLINDCHGNFTDIADAAGVGMHSININLRSEGAQALDINGDGWIDLYAGSELFINNGNLTFTNVGITDDTVGITSVSPWGIAPVFDEGTKFIDCDNSGRLCLAINNIDAMRLFEFDGVSHFSELSVLPPLYMNQSWGLNATDVDGDGRADLLIAGGIDQSVETEPQYSALRQQIDAARGEYGMDADDMLEDTPTPNALPQLLVNRGQYVINDFYDDGLTPTTRPRNGLLTFGDFDFGGTMDVVSAANTDLILMNRARSDDIITVSVLGAHGEQNQQGRIARMTPNARADITLLQIVDSGSGYLSNGPYDLTFATPYFGAYTISVRFANATYTAVAHSGDHVAMYANGTVAVRPRQ
jgi:hypothetical protein